MKSLNKVQLIGHTGTDVRTSESGNVARISLATNFLKKGGETVTEWHNIIAFGKLAEIAQKHISKGNQLFVQGHLRNSSYKDKEGIERYSTDIVAEDIIFLTPKSAL